MEYLSYLVGGMIMLVTAPLLILLSLFPRDNFLVEYLFFAQENIFTNLAAWLKIYLWPEWLLGVVFLIITYASFIYFIKFLRRKTWIIRIPLAIFLTWLVSFPSLMLLFAVENLDDPIASSYFPVNAAMKNVCYADWNKCPNTVEEMKGLDQSFYDLLKNKHVKLLKDNQKKEFVLVITHDDHRGVIFDKKNDFVDIQIQGCQIVSKQEVVEADILCKK